MNGTSNRRQVVTGLACGLVTAGIGKSSASLAAQGDYRDYFSPQLPDLRLLGTEAATSDEVKKARSILDGLTGKTPHELFSALAANTDKNKGDEPYRGGWRVRWNPLIVTMFKVTDEKPSGDLTPWCAASLNWALQRTGLKGTDSDSSGSFRDFPAGSKTVDPKTGDVVVFRSADSAKARLGHGHVGLFDGRTATHIKVLGGNQINSLGHHEFSSKFIPLNGPALVLDSFHSLAAFPRG